MRTETEILTHLEKLQKHDLFGFGTSVLITYLPFEKVKRFLNADVTAESWTKDSFPLPLTREAVMKEFANYMAFAWSKVQDHRGLSAQRSIQKLSAWAWLLGNDACVEKVTETDYAQYGAPKLKVICDAFGLPVPDDEPTRNMIVGKPCRSDCDEGCG
jgi:hypothetical protein